MVHLPSARSVSLSLKEVRAQRMKYRIQQLERQRSSHGVKVCHGCYPQHKFSCAENPISLLVGRKGKCPQQPECAPLPRRNGLPVCLSLEVSFSWNISGRDIFPLTLQDSSTTGNLLLGEQPVRFIYLSYHGCDEGSLH